MGSPDPFQGRDDAYGYTVDSILAISKQYDQ